MDTATLRNMAKEIPQYAYTEPMNLIRKILKARIEYLREQNDTVTSEDLPKIQGAIAEAKALLKITSVYEKDRTEFDGAYGL